MPDWQRIEPPEAGMDPTALTKARRYALTGGGSGLIVRGGKKVVTWGDPKRRYDLKSTTKSIGVTAVGLALADGKLRSLDQKARAILPEFGTPPATNAKTGWLDRISLWQLATQTAGFEKPGGFGKLLFEPGSKWCYSDGGPNWLADCITTLYRRDIEELMFERVFGPIGITSRDLAWRKNSYRPATLGGVARREFGSGIRANVDAMARIGLLYLRGGTWQDRQLVPADFVQSCRTTPEALRGLPVVGEIGSKPSASNHYGLLWWNNSDGALPRVPRDAFWSWGLHDSFIIVIPSLDIVAVRAGKSWKRDGDDDYKVLAGFLDPIVVSIAPAAADKRADAGIPPSPVIAEVTWAPAETIIREAKGSDNWPITWADDDALYTAYGDGWGFQPQVSGKLSLGFAKVTGDAGGFKGVNIRSETGEQIGDGKSGRKASGLLMVEGTLYMWVRNASKGRGSQLAVSTDHAKTWRWLDWRFDEFGYCTFVNFGRNYAGARDTFVYTVTHDDPSAYDAADRFVLMRVPEDRITEQAAYEFFAGLADGRPTWTRDGSRRTGVFENPGKCRRSSVTYHPVIKRYLWWQGHPSGDERFKGGFGVYDAPEPWGPWTCAYVTPRWDVGPGETACFPSKWMSRDGRTVHLIFSGDDCFSVRRATLRLRRQAHAQQ